jgi:hypothetical protein
MQDQVQKQDYIDGDWIYDIETYPNCFTISLIRADGKVSRVFEISDRKNDIEAILCCFRWLRDNNCRMVGFNNLGFDYPIIHEIMKVASKEKEKNYSTCTPKFIWGLAQKQIASFKGEGFGHSIPDKDIIIKQVDLYKIWHFDNKARSTSLKMLEFNMKSDNIEDLPFPVGMKLSHADMDILCIYNKHDVKMTLDFYKYSLDALNLRAELSVKYNKDFTNHNDTKIGKDYFIMRLEESMKGSCYTYDAHGKRSINQTKRDIIHVKDFLFDYYDFKQPAFKAILEWFRNSSITETKGVFTDVEEHDLGDVAQYSELQIKRKKFKSKPDENDLQQFKTEHPMGWVEEEELKATEYLFDANGEHIYFQPEDEEGSPDFTKKPKKARINKKSYWGCYKVADSLNVVIDGFRFDFGTGGIHGSVESKIIKARGDWIIRDYDVASMYPNIAISNRVFPKHLGEKFCDIYQDVYETRKSYKKGTPENAVMKLALNGVYGDSNNQFSPFYDPQYTMAITINGQLSLCLLAERLMEIEKLKLIQVNTDGVTAIFKQQDEDQAKQILSDWEKVTKLELETAQYKQMIIRDVNNYIAVYLNDKVKRKGAYQYEDLGWHQNQSALVVQRAAEAAMLHGTDPEEFIKNWKNKYDFLLRTKVPRNSRLVMQMQDGSEIQQQNICRYYPCKEGGKLVKIMPALEEGGEDRRLSLDKEWNVKTCNNILDFKDDIDYDYYIREAEKLIIEA